MGSRRVIAVVLAGGTGTRMGSAVPKQLLHLAGRPVLQHSIEAFEASEDVDEVLVLMHPDFLAEARDLAASSPKVTAVIAGGRTRNESTQAALDALSGVAGPDDKVLFHDAVRPLVDAATIARCVAALDRHDAVYVAVPSVDTIIEAEGTRLVAVPDRRRLHRGQTPQGFRLSTILGAYASAWQDPLFEATDDCSVVLRYAPQVAIEVVPGSVSNLKITEPIDLVIAEALLARDRV